jgi:hypothetical protein
VMACVATSLAGALAQTVDAAAAVAKPAALRPAAPQPAAPQPAVTKGEAWTH